MTTAAGLTGMLLLGLALGLQFNPVAAIAGSLLAAIIYGSPSAPSGRRPLAVGVLALAWLAGDGAVIGGSLLKAPPRAWPDWAAIVLRIVVSATVGYAAPAAAGVLVGRSVHRGTGWLSAGAVALAVAGALVIIAPMLADGIWRMLPAVPA